MEFKIKNLERTAKSIRCSIFFKELGLLINGVRLEPSSAGWYFLDPIHKEWSFDSIQEKELALQIADKTEKYCPPWEI